MQKIADLLFIFQIGSSFSSMRLFLNLSNCEALLVVAVFITLEVNRGLEV